MIMALPGLDLEGISKLIYQIDQTHILSYSVAVTPLQVHNEGQGIVNSFQRRKK